MVTLILEATALSVLVTWRSNVEWKPLTASPQKDRSTCLTETKPQVVMLPEELPITGVTAVAELEDEVVLVVAPVVDEVAAPVVDEEVALGWTPVLDDVVEAVVEVEVELVVVATEVDEVVAVVLEAMQLTLSLGQREHVAD
jgi:hypothetical protein